MMDQSMDSIPAGEFKAKCLGILEEVHETGNSVIVTKRGVPFAVIVPYEPMMAPKSALYGILKDSITIHGDIISPIDDKWEADE